MKRKQHEVDANQSCSCTSCLYGTDSDRASLKRVRAGSRIDKLYYGEYLPLRERKLLDKLVRTRAVYDDVRNQLLSESSSNVGNKANLKPRKHLPLSRNDKDHVYTDNSSDIFELVDLVDKGAVLGKRKISECCSCCSCSSKLRLHEHRSKSLRHRHAGGHVTSKSKFSRHRMAQDIRLGRHVRHAKHTRSDPCTCTLQFKDSSEKQLKTLKRMAHDQPVLESLPVEESKAKSYKKNKHRSVNQSGIEEANRKSLVKCACDVITNMESGARKSVEKIIETTQKLKHRVEASAINIEQIQKENKKHQVPMGSLLVKEPALGEISRRSLVKCACKAKENIGHRATKISKKIKDTKQKFKEEVEESIRKSIHKKNLKQKKEREALRIRKDSLTVYRKQIERKQQFKDWECDFECFPEECVPEECYRIKKHKKARKSKIRGYGTHATQHKIKETETSSASDANVQAYNIKRTTTTGTKHQKLITNGNGSNSAESFIREERQRKKKKTKQTICLCEKPTRHETRSRKSMTTNMAQGSRSSVKRNKIAKISRSSIGIVRTLSKGNTESDLSHGSRQAVRIGSSFSFNIEFYKNKPGTEQRKQASKDMTPNEIRKSRHRNKASNVIKKTQAGEYALKRCFCTLKLKPKKTKSKINKYFAKEAKTNSKSKKVNTEDLEETSLTKINPLSVAPDLLSNECEPRMCITDLCNPEYCQQILEKRRIKYNSIQTNTKNQTKSTPSLTSKSISAVNYKHVQTTQNTELGKPGKNQPSPLSQAAIPLNESVMPQKQAVRIGSSFSFNIEFAKERPSDNPRKPDIKITRPKKKKKEKNKNVNKVKFIQPILISSSTTKSRYSSTKHKLRRCLCTLRLGKHEKKTRKTKTLSKETVTDGQSIPQIHHAYPATNKAKETEKKEYLKQKLLPYECEPGICVPGKCNPYDCKEIIIKREARRSKRHVKQSNTEYRKTKSTSSFTSTPLASLKVKKVQSTSPAFKRKNVTVPREARVISSCPNRETVRIGSNFSFNIEFFKDTLPPNDRVKNVFEKPTNKISCKKRAIQEHKKSQLESKNNVISSSTQVKKKDRSILIGPAIKRCLCTLKLQKSGKNKVNSDVKSIGTETIFPREEIYPKAKNASKSTKTNKKLHYIDRLESFECEPYICVPGKCDPYQCLEIIKKRNPIRDSQEFGILTDRVKKKSKASVTRKSTENAKGVQSNTKYQKKSTRIKYLIPNDNAKNPSRQAVRISSNFSFNVEFFKDRNSGENFSKVKYDTTPMTGKNKVNKSHKALVSEKSQSVVTKKKNKALGVEHVLKRCFCTLKLQNKVKQQDSRNKTYMRPLNTTVMPIRVYTKRMNITCPVISNPLPIEEKNYSKNTYYGKEVPIIVKQSQYSKSRASVTCKESLIKEINKNHSNTEGLSPFLKSCFCTMNIQVEKSDKRSYKLKPYECEPGICVPNQCDPNVCQKIIMKRLMKKVSTMAGTKVRSKSISSGTTPVFNESKKNQVIKTVPEDKEQRNTLKYKLPRPHKQAVRVGSNFSFNIEFCKEKSPTVLTTGNYNKQPRFSTSTKSVRYRDKKVKNRGTRGLKNNYYDTSSQSMIKMQHRASSATPSVKKCFCTLKLQKKGRQHMANNAPVVTLKTNVPHKNIEHPKVITTTTGQNTNAQKPQKHKFHLSPYECEPLVCIPGECDPYKCLELIHKRTKKCKTREFGTDSVQNTMISTSSLTTQQNRQTKKKHIQAKTIVPTNKTVTKPSRQAVRIGSSCSFNIEFYKDRSPSNYILNASSTPQDYVKKQRKINEPTPKNRQTEKKKNREHSSQGTKSMRHRDSQVQNLAKRVKSTNTTSFIKRCFCTLKLHEPDQLNNRDTEIKQNPKPSFLTKCLCKLKVKTVKESPHKTVNTGTETLVPTNKFIKKQTQVLQPYECQPGICVPGECNPYLCDKVIKNRKAKLHTKMSITDAPETRSISTSHKHSNMPKGTVTRLNKEKLRRENGETIKKRSKELNSSPVRNIVRIGSNFSFDIEFYKNRTPNFNQKPAKVVKERSKNGKSQKPRINLTTKNKGFTSSNNDISLHNRNSQTTVSPKDNKATGIRPILKRCFCTLKLLNEKKSVADDTRKDGLRKGNANKIKFSTRGTETPGYKELPNAYTKNVMAYNIKPYECGRNFCVPGECDPYECETRIKSRLRETATSTQKRKMKSATSMIRSAGKSKDKIQQLKEKHVKKLHTNNGNNKRFTTLSDKPNKRINLSQSRQVVRIGSSFSFDIDFCKEKTPKSLKPYFPDMSNRAEVSKEKNKKGSTLKNATTDHRVSIRNRQSQLKEIKTESKGSGAGPLLKRCFCTLKFQKVGKLQQPVVLKLEPEDKDLSVTAKMEGKQKNDIKRNVGSETKIIGLKPYECEPNICIPGKCDPFECEERIKARKMRESSTGTKSPTMKSVFSVTRDCNKVQTNKNQTAKKMNKQNLSLGKALKKAERYSHNLHVAEVAKPANRQAVRIGSNFSFNIELYKGNLAEGYNHINNDNDRALKGKSEANVSKAKSTNSKWRSSRCQESCPKLKTKCQASNCQESHINNRKLQVANVKRESKSSGVAPLLKRCFCSLTLQKKDIQSTKAMPPKVKNKSTLTKAETILRTLDQYECEPGICIPGECNPYECEERIKKRLIKQKSRKSNTRRHLQVSVASMVDKSSTNSKSKRVQYKAVEKLNQKASMIVQQPRYPFVFDRINNAKQAVKIGSNFSFNIKFYKENSPIKRFGKEHGDVKHSHYSKKENVAISKPTSDGIKMTNTNICKLKNCKVQVKGSKTENKASAVGNALKRCFCTSKLHKTNLQNHYPNMITVGRVDQINIKSPFKPSQSCPCRDQGQMKPSKYLFKNKKCDCASLAKDTKTVSTKVNNKYLMLKDTEKNAGEIGKNDNSDMETILPYTPRKFNKHMSKTLLLETKEERNLNFDRKCCSYCKKYLNHAYSTGKDKPQSKIKYSKRRGKTIEIKETTETPNLRPSKPKGFLFRCIQIFSKGHNNSEPITEECPYEPPNCQVQTKKKAQNDMLKTSKSERRPQNVETTVPKKSKSLKITTLAEKNKCQDNSHQNEQKKKYSKLQEGDAGRNEQWPGQFNKMKNPTNDFVDKKCICLTCQARKSKTQNKIVKFTLTPTAKGDSESPTCDKLKNCSRQTRQKDTNENKSKLYRYFKCFKSNNEEVKQSVKTPDTCNKNQIEHCRGCTCVCCTNEKGSLKKERRKYVELKGQKTLTGLNYKYVKKKDTSAKTKKSRCPCQNNVNGNITCLCPNQNCLCTRYKPVKKTCLCGSRVCGKEYKKENVGKFFGTQKLQQKKKLCVCGSVACAREAKKEHVSKWRCRKKVAKSKKQKIKDKAYLKRQKQYDKEDRARRRRRILENVKLFKQAVKYKDTSDVLLAVQSLSDIAKLGCTTLGDVARSTFRTVTDPRHTVECLKTSARDPKRGWKVMKDAVSDSNIGATYKRVKLRVGAMSCTKEAKGKLESCALTNYLMHMADKNPKKRLKRKPRKREQLDFNCSLFMGSLRKRPFLAVYNLCPWFYPHFLSMLTIWRQFSDIMLFLLAVVVWSPCILCMEACRAMMCCFLCTG